MAGQKLRLFYFVFLLKNQLRNFLWKEKSFIVRFPTVCVEAYFEFDCVI